MECKILDGTSACGNFVVRAIGRRKSPGPKGFPISLNGALIVIPRTRVESEMAAVLNAITLPADSFQLANDALIAGEVVSNTCYRYSVFYPRSLIQKFVHHEVTKRMRESRNSVSRSSMKLKMFALRSLHEQEERELTGVNFPLIFERIN